MRSVSKLVTSFGGAVAALGLATSPAFAQQDGRSTLPPTQIAHSDTAPANDEQPREAWREAGEFSEQNVVLSYVIYGRTSRYSNDFIAEQVGARLRNLGLSNDEFRIWLAEPDQEGVRAASFVDGTMTHDNVMGLAATMEHMPQAVSMYREHAPSMRERLEAERRTRLAQSAAPAR